MDPRVDNRRCQHRDRLHIVVVTIVSLVGGMALLATEMSTAGAETVAPPTPRGVRAVARGADVGGVDGPQIQFTAENGGLAGTTSSARAWTTEAAARNGQLGLRVSGSNAPAFLRWDGAVPQNRRHASVRTWIRLGWHQKGQSVDLFTVANARGSRHFDFFVSALTGRFQWDIYGQRSDRSDFVAQAGRWYLIEARVSFAGTTHRADVRIDGVHQGTITSPGWNTTVTRFSVGAFSAKTHTQDYDDLAVRVGHVPQGWIPSISEPRTVEVRWNPVVDQGSGLREYQIWRNGRWYAWVPAGTNRFVDTAPSSGANYQIRAMDRHGNRSGWSPRTYVTGG